MNMKFLLSLLLAVFPLILPAQLTGYAAVSYEEEPATATDERIHLHVDLVPLFSGCDQPQMFTLEQQFCSHEKIESFIQENLQYPEAAKAAGIAGKVKLRAIVEADGLVSGVRIVKSDVPELEAEAIRLVMSMPPWTPAKLKEKTVRAFKEIIIPFELPQ